MASLLRVLRSRWFLTGLGTMLIGLLVWLLGPLLDWLEPLWPRLALIAAAVLVWAGVNLWIDRRHRARDTALTSGITELEASAQVAGTEVAELRARLSKAMATLHKASGRRGYLYEQPWYMFIGPSGAGKTTALMNAHLTFRLAETSADPSQEVTKTRLFDWYFTDEAVLIDSAGKFTEQKDTVDATGWNELLALLRKTRPRQPLNGILVTVGLTELIDKTPAARQSLARAIRRRLKELNDTLDTSLPVYMLVTKADVLDGFTEYFDGLGRDGRAQVWGMTFPLSGPPGGPAAAFAAEFRQLTAILAARIADRLQEERSLDRRPAIASFPAHVATVEPEIAEFLQEAFGPSDLDRAAFLRGVYLISGTQDGTTIDRMVGAMARTFGIDRDRVTTLRPERGRSYFLENLLKRVIFGEAMLVNRDPAVIRRHRAIQIGTWAVGGLAMLAGIVLLLVGWQNNTSAVARFDAAVAVWRQAVAATPLQPVAAADLHRVAPLLDQARALPFGVDSADSVGLSLGLGQQDKLKFGADMVYRQALERILLPRLVWRAEQQTRESISQPEQLYEATRVYLMLGSQGPLDPRLLHDWAEADWRRSLYPGPAQAPLREGLLRHLDALLTGPLPEIAIDQALVADARAVFSNISPAARVYSLLKPADDRSKPWSPSEAAGVGTARWFTRRSGTPLTEAIPGLYTPAGFWTTVLPGLPSAIARVNKENWVLGRQAGIDQDPQALQKLGEAVIGLYTKDYIARWSALLDDLDPIAATSSDQAVADLRVLSAQRSPIREMLSAITQNLTLAPPAAPTPQTGVAGAVAQVAQAAGVARYLTPGGEPLGRAVDAAFRELREFVEAGLDTALASLREVGEQLSHQVSGLPVSTGNATAALANMRSPQPVKRWLTTLAAGGRMAGGDMQRKTVLAAYNIGGGAAAAGGAPVPPPGPLCKALERRFPLAPDAQQEASVDDFARLFAPSGAMDQFFNTQLRAFVAVQGSAWRPQAYMGTEPPVGAADVAAFQRIDRIRQAFFTFGQAPRVAFLLRPVSADAGTKTARLELGGLPSVYQEGKSSPPQSFEWPGPGGMVSAQVVFDPPATSGTALYASGPWALFRLFAKAQRSAGDEAFQLTFTQGERQVVFEIQAGANNAFSPGLFRDFRCPGLNP